MILLTMILLATGGLFAVLARLIYKGKTELIHDYHQKRVSDKEGYGKAFGKAMGVISGGMILGGGISLFGEKALWCALGVLLMGMIIGIAAIVRVQKKFNNGIV